MQRLLLAFLVILASCNYHNDKDTTELELPEPETPPVVSQEEMPSYMAYALDAKFVNTCAQNSPTSDYAVPAYGYVSYVSEIACIATNLLTQNIGSTQFLRYLSLTDLYNTNQTNEVFVRLQDAIFKGLNSISLQPNLGTPVFIGNPPVVARIDLREFGISANEWEKILLPLYPYATAYFNHQYTDGNEKLIRDLTGSQQAWLRADWVLREVTQPPLYWDFLGLPDNLNAFFKLVGVNEDQDIQNFIARRSAIRQSGVANWNRVIDYHPLFESKFRGDLWRTFDVINQIDFRNFFAFPLGPDERTSFGTHPFQFDASEFIFGLPNGLDAYYFSDAKGRRIDEALTSIASDRANTNPFIGTAPYVVRAGVSCMRCHSGGLNAFQDQLRSSAVASTIFSQKDIDNIDYLYAPTPENDRLLASHDRVFTSAMSSGLPEKLSVFQNNVEPVFWTVKWYEQSLDFQQAASELGISVKSFSDCMAHSANLAAVLGIGDLQNGSIARRVWELHIDEAMKQCNIGLQKKFIVVTPPPPPPPETCHYSIENKSYGSVSIVFTEGTSSNQVVIAVGDTYTASRSGNPVARITFSDGVTRRYNIQDCKAYYTGNDVLYFKGS